ncbi:MAG: hypothetical protein ACK4SY_00520 [Pyrobaculum sp.]
MGREDFYLYTAPIFAIYLGAISGNDALRLCALNVAELDEREARRLFVASLTPAPSSHFLEDKSEAARLFGFALAQEESGVDRQVVVHSFLESVRSLALAKTEARARVYESISSSLGALFILPLFFLFLWALGVVAIDGISLAAVVLSIAAAMGLYAIYVTPKDVSLAKAYSWAFPAAISTGLLAAYIATPPLFFLAAGFLLYGWLVATSRLWWFKIRGEIAPMLRSAAALLKEGAPPDVITGRLSDRFKIAQKIAYGYFVPSKYFILARGMYRAITEAGGSTAIRAVEHIQTLIDLETQTVKKMLKLAGAYFALFTFAVLVLAYSISTAVKTLGGIDVGGYIPFLSPPPLEEVRQMLSITMATIIALYATVFLAPLGLHNSLTLGGAAGLLANLALGYLF